MRVNTSPHDLKPYLRTLVLLVITTASLDACRDASAPSRAEFLAGSWQWVSSVKSQRTHTPATEGFVARLDFMPEDERSGTFVYRRQGEVAVEGTYEIGYEDAPGNDFIVLSDSIDFLAHVAWIAVGKDSLRLGGVMEGGYNSVYARVPQ